MFIGGRSWYGSDGSQHGRGSFLIIAGGHTHRWDGTNLITERLPLRAAVRTVSLSQLGHFMMGTVRIGKDRVIVSGAYGSDGLPCSPEKFPNAFQSMLPLPAELEAEFWNGGGHNTAGKEGPSLRAWARQNEAQLRKAGK